MTDRPEGCYGVECAKCGKFINTVRDHGKPYLNFAGKGSVALRCNHCGHLATYRGEQLQHRDIPPAL
jgi:hypothetical protein